MGKQPMGYVYIALTVVFTVYGQLVIKWQMTGQELPPGLVDKVVFILKQYLNPWVLSGLGSAFVASMAWIAAMTQFELSFAYPFMSTAFVLVMILSMVLFGEALNAFKLAGTLLIIAGMFVLARGL